MNRPAGGASRRAALAKKRQSRRPSRLGLQAGATPKPDQVREPDAGFPDLLKQVWQHATEAADLHTAVRILLTLDGRVPADVQLRALRTTDETALQVLCGASWRTDPDTTDTPDPGPADGADGGPVAFLGEIGLTTSGRLVVRVPSQGPLDATEQLVAGVLRVPWSARTLTAYRRRAAGAARRCAQAVADCRDWLDRAGTPGRNTLLDQLQEAAVRTAPFVLYQEGRQYTNFRERNTLAGKTLWPGHPDCALSSLKDLPLDLWSDHDAVMVVCLSLLLRSAGYARIEEANGTQLTLDHVARQLEGTRQVYNAVPGGQQVPPAARATCADLEQLAVALAERRRQVMPRAQLYREIHGALMHKIERVAAPRGEQAHRREAALTARLRASLPLAGATLEDLGRDLEAAPEWLAQPRGGFATGLEALIHATVAAATEAFDADFAMSRGLRSLPTLTRALRDQDWTRIVAWDLPDFFCCVVPAPTARRHFADSSAQLADTAWAMSSRMQYNSWHFIAGNLPKGPALEGRDYFVPPTIPDLAFYSDQHHHGHVTARVRFSIRSPQPVRVDGRDFNGFMDLRLLRCQGAPFDEQDMLAAHRTSAFIAHATSLAAALVAAGRDLEITSFDSRWHWESVMAAAAAAFPATEPQHRPEVA